MNQLTVRGFDRELERRLRKIARDEKLSLNKAVLKLLRRGAGLDPDAPERRLIGNSLDEFAGTWSEEEGSALLDSIADTARVDPKDWS